MPKDPSLVAHLEWIGYVQPSGLVVSAPALLAAQAHLNRNIVPEHNRFLDHVTEISVNGTTAPGVTDLPALLHDVMGWEKTDLLGGPGADPLPDSLEVTLPEYNETLRPTYAVREFTQGNGDAEPAPWLMLIQVLPPGTDMDEVSIDDDRRWQASPQARFERLLREEAYVPIGLLTNGTHLRLVYAPRGETSGHMTFPVQAMTEVAGRPIFAALHMLLSAERLFSLPEKQRLPAILEESRKYQNLVSTKLAEQVLAALYELMRGFQAADARSRGELLREVLREDPNHVYAGLLTVLLRLVFILYAEDRGLLSNDPVYVNHYSVAGLFERLRSDQGRHPDTMDQRYGAWAQLLSLFRLIYDGADHGDLRLPARHGHLFNPDRYNFLEGRTYQIGRVMGERVTPPMVSDGVVFRVLRNLLVLDGERISYRTLDVEQIGSVYEAMMGFSLEVAKGRSIAVKPKKRYGAPTTINLDALLAEDPGKRAKWLRDQSEQTVTGKALTELKAAETAEDIVAALGKKIASEVTPNIATAGAMVLQPGDERRRSSSHYTPRSLTEPIVRTTLRPVLEQLGDKPTPEQILDLKVCDPAMGSGAFLVEACRQLGDKLVEAWNTHRQMPDIPPDEDELLHARRLVAQRCLYGVDKNPLATDLAKLSLWLATLAKDHPFTFLDHALRHGDSLVGLSRRQIASFHWTEGAQLETVGELVEERLAKAIDLRRDIQAAGDEIADEELRLMLKEADEALDEVRLVGDLVIAAFFGADKARDRESGRAELLTKVQTWLAGGGGYEELCGIAEGLREMERPVVPFHWEIEFGEVFGREKPGFDAIVGNPPFLGGTRISTLMGAPYLDWVASQYNAASRITDLCAYFFVRGFRLLGSRGALGFVATNTISQGDTRATGLQAICEAGGTIYAAEKRYQWPGLAAVVVSVVHISRSAVAQCVLGGRTVDQITAYLFHAGGHSSPQTLEERRGRGFVGTYILGIGFVFDDRNPNATPVRAMHGIINRRPRSRERIRSYLGGLEFNQSPTQSSDRFVIDFEEMSQSEARQWPELLAIVEAKVRPARKNVRKDRKELWWRHANLSVEIQAYLRSHARCLAMARTTTHMALAFVRSGTTISDSLVAFLYDDYATYCLLQSRLHEVWARFLASSLKDDLRYAPTDCFETFPFPANHEYSPALEAAGKAYYEYRAALMIENDEGLTKTYNRFHDPDEKSPEIRKLRELHAAMDRAVLDAYGWTDIDPTCEFLLDYEEEEDEEGGSRKMKKPWRYRWPDAIRDEVLGRLLSLNQQRAEEERIKGLASEGKKSKKGKSKRSRSGPNEAGSLFSD